MKQGDLVRILPGNLIGVIHKMGHHNATVLIDHNSAPLTKLKPVLLTYQLDKLEVI